MALSFDHLDFLQVSVEMLEPKMEINGKRASAFLNFLIKSGELMINISFCSARMNKLVNVNYERS